MNIKHVLLAIGLTALFIGNVTAQDINSTSNSSVNTSAQSSAANQGNAQNITFNSPQQPTHTTQRVVTAPGMGLGSFGTSFSSDNCSNTIAGQLSVVGFGASAGKALLEQNCAHIRRGYAFGQIAAFAASNHQTDLMVKAEAMVAYEFCMADGNDSETAKACMDLGMVRDGHKVALEKTAVVNDRRADTSERQAVVMGSAPTSSLDNTSVVNESWYQNAQKPHH